MAEYYATHRHMGHTKNEFLDDYDFDYIVEEMTEFFRKYKYSKENGDFDEDGSDALDLIEDAVREVVEEKACSDFGWKYGFDTFAYSSIAEAILEEIKEKY